MNNCREILFRLGITFVNILSIYIFIDLSQNHANWFGSLPHLSKLTILMSLAISLLVFTYTLYYFIKNWAKPPSIKSGLFITLTVTAFFYSWYVGKMVISYYF